MQTNISEINLCYYCSFKECMLAPNIIIQCHFSYTKDFYIMTEELNVARATICTMLCMSLCLAIVTLYQISDYHFTSYLLIGEYKNNGLLRNMASDV